MYCGAALYCQAVIRGFFQFTDLCCPCRNSLHCGEFLVLFLCFQGDGKELMLGDGDRDVQGMVDNFADHGRIFNGGGVAVLGPRDVGDSGIFDGRRGDNGGSDSGSKRGSGTGSAVMSFPDCPCIIWVL
jgi:hypothetical protein